MDSAFDMPLCGSTAIPCLDFINMDTNRASSLQEPPFGAPRFQKPHLRQTNPADEIVPQPPQIEVAFLLKSSAPQLDGSHLQWPWERGATFRCSLVSKGTPCKPQKQKGITRGFGGQCIAMSATNDLSRVFRPT